MNKLSPTQTIPLTKPEHAAIKAVAHGEADKIQQQMAINAIVNNLCRRQTVPYFGSDAEAATFVCGRMFVGDLISRVVRLPVSTNPTEEDE